MELVKPNLLLVNGRCYRSFYSGEGTIHSSGANSYEADEEYVDGGEGIGDDDNYDCVEVEKDENGNYTHSMAVAPEFYGMIIGYKGQNLNRLEHATKCRVIIPKRDDSSSRGKTIILRSSAKRSVLSARSKILAIIEKSRSKFEPNYFIHMPIDDESISERYLQFKKDVLMEVKKEPLKYRGICEEIFQDPGRLHLTICMLLIMDQGDEKAQVISKLENLYKEKILGMLKNKKLTIKVAGLAYMNDDINAVDVLYGKIELNEDLQAICELIVDQFKSTLFISRERAKVVLHLTLLNSKFKMDKAEREGWLKERKDQREKFSVAELLNKFGDFYFGETQIKSIELSIMHTRTDKGGYKSTLTLDLTKS